MQRAIALSRVAIEDNERISATVAAQGPKLRAFVRRQIADLGEVEDIVQDSFAQLVAAYRLMQPIEHVAAWLRRVATNRIIDRFRQRSRQPSLNDGFALHEPGRAAGSAGIVEEWLAPEATGPEASYVRQVLTDELIAALEELPAEQREVFVAHELGGQSFRELAVRLGVGVNTLLGRKHAAVQHLRRRLRDIRSEFDY
jgi:RNA polymerase sigma factor (sigma-70 family)